MTQILFKHYKSVSKKQSRDFQKRNHGIVIIYHLNKEVCFLRLQYQLNKPTLKPMLYRFGCPAVLAEVKSPKAFTNHIARDFFIVSGN